MMILLLLLALIGIVFALSAILPQDGYGHRPAPRSHIDSFPTRNNCV